MSDRDLRERLRRQTGRAVAESIGKQQVLDRALQEAPQPGDVFILGDDPESPVEWVVLEAGPEVEPPIAVPADTHPMAGSRDLALDDPSAGPLILRLGQATSLAAGVFDPSGRRGVLEPESLALAQRTYRQVKSGEARGSVRQREIDVDPAYEDWLHDFVEPAREALRAAAGGDGTRERLLAFPERPVTASQDPARRMVSARWVHALAAALVLVTLGLSSWIVSQQRQIARLSRPSFNLSISEIYLGDVERSAEPMFVPRGATDLLLYLVFDEVDSCESYDLHLLGRRDQEIWGQTLASWPADDVNLMLPRSVLEQGPLTLKLYGICDGELELLDERQLRIQL